MFENAGHFFQTWWCPCFPSRIYIESWSRSRREEGFDPCRERGEQCETTPRSVELLRFWRRVWSLRSPPPCPPPQPLPHFQLEEIQILTTWPPPSSLTENPPHSHTAESFSRVPSSALDYYHFFMHINFFSSASIKYDIGNLERNFNRFFSSQWLFLHKKNLNISLIILLNELVDRRHVIFRNLI